ncbi:MAG: hypothetical protein ACRCXT_05800 [Paraclostridium sp.]
MYDFKLIKSITIPGYPDQNGTISFNCNINQNKLYLLYVDNSNIALSGLFIGKSSRVHGMIYNTPTTVTVANNLLRFVYFGEKPITTVSPIILQLYEA